MQLLLHPGQYIVHKLKLPGGAFGYACNHTGPERRRNSESKSLASTWVHLPHSSHWSAQQGQTLTLQKTQAGSIQWWSPPRTGTSSEGEKTSAPSLTWPSISKTLSLPFPKRNFARGAEHSTGCAGKVNSSLGIQHREKTWAPGTSLWLRCQRSASQGDEPKFSSKLLLLSDCQWRKTTIYVFVQLANHF